MKISFAMKAVGAAGLAAIGIATTGVYAGSGVFRSIDFGQQTETRLHQQSLELFGVKKPVFAPASGTIPPVRDPYQDANDHLILAKGLRVEYVTRKAGNSLDMMVMWPNVQRPTHIIGCIEGGRSVIGTFSGGTVKFNPSVQRIHLRTGEVETILRGMTACDGIIATPWGTILATEETSDGGAYEILNPLTTTNLTVKDRMTGIVVDLNGVPSTLVRKQTALPTMAWEGIGYTSKGVLYAGDELRPGTGAPDADGGSIFKFIPNQPWKGGTPIQDLSLSPFAAGQVFAMQISCVADKQQFGQGCEVGQGVWLPVNAATARANADAIGATGYYRPEDLHLDPDFSDSENPQATRFCWTNTGNEDAENWSEVFCAVDRAPDTASSTMRTITANRFVEGDMRMNSADNLAFQPGTGNTYVIEDDEFGEVWACLPDGTDRDLKSDGCISILSLVDPSAEPTGFFFSADGKAAYLSIQHSDDKLMPKYDDYGTDDLLKITGFKVLGR